MRKTAFLFVIIILLTATAYADRGLVSVRSSHSVRETADRLESALNAKGVTMLIRINHAEGAKKVGKNLRPIELVIFGNPKIGTPLMQCNRSVGIDLPLKALIWEDDDGTVWYSYNDAGYLTRPFPIQQCSLPGHGAG